MFPPPTTLVSRLEMVLMRPPWGAAERVVKDSDSKTKLLILLLILVPASLSVVSGLFK